MKVNPAILNRTASEKPGLQAQSMPWDYQDNTVSVALTGKAFKHALERQN